MVTSYDFVLKNIFQQLKFQKKSQIDLASYLGITKNVISDWKSGKNKSYMKHLDKIAEFLGVSVDELLGSSSNTVQFSPQKQKLVSLIDQLDEPDMYKLEGILEEMLRNEKYISAANQA
ncbi:MAG: helix-turn-helix transcriptional regulator [Oscillospiraceae bacterium]|nr:helix-turn-helix transcriptional regulator [Oscillospiraceae bacterium]